MSANNISKSLGLTPITVNNEVRLVQAPQAESKNEELDIDLENAREGLYNALEMSKQAVEDMARIASTSQNHKAYEVFNKTIETFSNLSMNLAELHAKKQKLQPVSAEGGENKVINNNVFVGSTAELQKLLESMKNNEMTQIQDYSNGHDTNSSD